MAVMKRAVASEEQGLLRDRYLSTLAIGACIIAAVRLARDENINTPSPRLLCAVSDSISLAERILKTILGR